MYEIKDLKTNCIGLSFPEMHEIRIAETDKLVGLLSLIGGRCIVEYPDIKGEIIYEAYPLGRQCFEYQEREYWINQGLEAVVKHLNMIEEKDGEGGNSDLSGETK